MPQNFRKEEDDYFYYNEEKMPNNTINSVSLMDGLANNVQQPTFSCSDFTKSIFSDNTYEVGVDETYEIENVYNLQSTENQEEQKLLNIFNSADTLEKSEKKNKKTKVPEFVRISELIQKEMHLKYYANDFYVYNGNGLYQQNLPAIESKILEINNYSNSYLIKEVLNRLRIINVLNDTTINRDIINFKNCIYNLVTRKTTPFSPEIFNTTQLNVNYIPDEKLCVNEFAEQFLDEICNGNVERKKALLEFTGYTLTMRTDLKKACYLYSPESNTGKSTYLELLENIVDINNVSSVSLTQYSDRFAPSGIINKLLNSVAETKRKVIKDVENFKASVSGDTMAFEKKYVDVVIFRPYVKNWYAMNKLPTLAPDIAGEDYYSRLLIIKFERVFSKEEINTFDKKSLFSQEVLDYIANISLREYLKMLDSETKQFSNEIESTMLVEAYKHSNIITCDVRDFLDTLTYFKGEITRYQMYQQYLDWCKKNKQQADSRPVFYQNVLDTHLYEEISKKNNKFFKQITIE